MFNRLKFTHVGSESSLQIWFLREPFGVLWTEKEFFSFVLGQKSVSTGDNETWMCSFKLLLINEIVAQIFSLHPFSLLKV